MEPLLITMGDPSGIGPELIVKTLLDQSFEQINCPIEIVGDVGVLCHAGKIFDCESKSEQLTATTHSITFGDKKLCVHAISNLDPNTIEYGNPDNNCGKAMAAYIEYAIARCLDKTAAGIATCPINKAAINAAGFHFPGHTELLADRCGIEKVVMMLAGERLKVCLVTTHLAHRDITANLNQAEIVQTIRITATTFRNQFGIKEPRLAVLALNPHASENGLFGDEEERIIAPAIATVRAEGIDASGPHSADTLFHFAAKGKYDAVICLGAIIRGETPHFDFIASEAAKGVAHVALAGDVPCVFGIITTENLEQALDRAGTKSGNKGRDAALTAIEMCELYSSI